MQITAIATPPALPSAHRRVSRSRARNHQNTQQGSNPREILRAAKRAEILDLRLAGKNLREIGRQVGVSHATVQRQVIVGMQELYIEQAGALKETSVLRLLRIANKLDRRMFTDHEGQELPEPNYPAIDRYLRVYDQLAKILGFYEIKHAVVAVEPASQGRITTRDDILAAMSQIAARYAARPIDITPSIPQPASGPPAPAQQQTPVFVSDLLSNGHGPHGPHGPND